MRLLATATENYYLISQPISFKIDFNIMLPYSLNFEDAFFL